ncbi:hypothetical protein [Halomonas sp. E14]|uniref:hypothetical protein n=2 Tax=unclassified Halomonas TaxID=2609666 RepID=UPI00403EA3C5
MEKSRTPPAGQRTTDIDAKEGEAMRDKARRLTERDTPDDAPAQGSQASSDSGEVYRPDANVDDQKHSGKKPGIDTRRDATPVGGAQATRDKTAHKENIDDKADQASSSRRNG